MRVFLAVARRGSVRAAARDLDVNHATVSRRVIRLETALGAKLFVRAPSGYLLTPAAEELQRAVEQMEVQATAVERRLTGRDEELRGTLRVTVPLALAENLMMPDIADFTASHPDIDLRVMLSYGLVDLARHKADVAIRMSNDPAPSLVGRRLVKMHKAIYATPEYLRLPRDSWTWLGWGDASASPPWIQQSPFPKLPMRTHLDSPLAQLQGAKAGMGISMLPCFLGDCEPALRRVDGRSIPERDLWLLTHDDLRRTGRVRAFMDHMARAILDRRDLIEGRSPRPEG